MKKTTEEQMSRCRQRMQELGQARLYDYEPRAVAKDFLAKAKGVRHGA